MGRGVIALRVLAAVIAIVVALTIGVAGMVLGESDDSPGLQFLGLMLIVGAIVSAVRMARR
jgi:hypothetical protein